MIFMKDTPQGLVSMSVNFTEDFGDSDDEGEYTVTDVTRSILPEFMDMQTIDQQDWRDIILRIMLEIKSRMEPGPGKPTYGSAIIRWALPECEEAGR